jgi:regulator of sigma E protease
MNLAASTSGVLLSIVAFLFVLSIVVFVHEFGHFIVARWCGVAVKTFSIGFGREIFGFTDKKGTRWRVAWIPLGGYVKFLDDENAASQPSREAIANMTPAERAGAFQTKPLWQRAAVSSPGRWPTSRRRPHRRQSGGRRGTIARCRRGDADMPACRF